MKILLVLLVIMALSVSACFDDSPTGPSNNNGGGTGSKYSGTFTITDTLAANSCAVPAPPSIVMTVTVIGDSIWLGTFPGAWDPVTTSGGGTSPETKVPVDPPECFAYYTVTFHITFTDPDHFYGTYGATYTKDPGCPNPDPCTFTYRIGGTR